MDVYFLLEINIKHTNTSKPFSCYRRKRIDLKDIPLISIILWVLLCEPLIKKYFIDSIDKNKTLGNKLKRWIFQRKFFNDKMIQSLRAGKWKSPYFQSIQWKDNCMILSIPTFDMLCQWTARKSDKIVIKTSRRLNLTLNEKLKKSCLESCIFASKCQVPKTSTM